MLVMLGDGVVVNTGSASDHSASSSLVSWWPAVTAAAQAFKEANAPAVDAARRARQAKKDKVVLMGELLVILEG